MDKGRIAGPYDPFYPEVTRKLRDNVSSYLARWIYLPLVTLFYVEEEWGDDPVWVHGIVRATKTHIAKEAGVPRKSFDRGWKRLTDAGIVKEREDGTFLLPYYKKKGYDAISAREIRERQRSFDREQEEANTRISRLEELHTGDLEDPDGERDAHFTQNEEKVPQNEEKVPQNEEKVPHSEVRASSLKALQKNSLSSLNTVISGFYRGIGQKRIAKEKRERAFKIGKKLREDGFSLEDIAFAVEWTLENAKEEPYDFAIIQHTIGQAIAARGKIESQRRAIEERDKAVEEEKAEREAEEQERKEMETYKAGLDPEEREKLREEARADLMESSGLTADMVNDFLINIKENEILRNRLTEESR